MDQPSLDGCREKIKRAVKHTNELNQEVDAFWDTKPCRAVGEFDPETGWLRIKMTVSEYPRPRWGVIVGDIAHNLRSALDHLVWQLVLAAGKRPGRHNFYPVFTDRDEFFCAVEMPARQGKGPLGGVPLDSHAWKVIEKYQPYNAGDKAQFGPLRVLTLLSNTDKHRFIHPAFAALEEGTVWFDVGTRDVTGAHETVLRLHAGRSFKDGTPVLDLRYRVTGPNPDVQMEGDFPAYVAFGDPSRAIKATTFPGFCELIELLVKLIQPQVEGG